jgi:hypothetical protein
MKKASSHKRRGFYAEHNRTQIQASSLIFQKPGFLQELAPSGTLICTEVAGLHRASPSATLDKRIVPDPYDVVAVSYMTIIPIGKTKSQGATK